jgi:hypothetical protein
MPECVGLGLVVGEDTHHLPLPCPCWTLLVVWGCAMVPCRHRYRSFKPVVCCLLSVEVCGVAPLCTGVLCHPLRILSD